MEMASEKHSQTKLLREFCELVRKGAENRGLDFAVIAWFPDPLNKLTEYETDWNGENFAARGAVRELLTEIRMTDSHDGTQKDK